MIFTELRFVFFFVIVYLVYWFFLTRNTPRKVFLLAASYAFYAAWDWRFLGLILAITSIDFAASHLFPRYPDKKKQLLILSLACDLAFLGFFKYFNFFTSSFADLLGLLGIQANYSTLHIVLPVGISFYTFQSMSYTIDVYRGILKPARSILDFALFVAFFPQLVAGPIVKAKQFLPQLEAKRDHLAVCIRSALLLFLIGYIKKAVVSDNLAPLVDALYASPESYSCLSSFTGTILFSLQIYCDFSGYSDMAIACAMLLGYRLVDNFNFPYFSPNITLFWRRWHMSLSSWLKDYLYIPLGGNRHGRARQYRNLMLTMLLGGLWHGAAWTFVIWGGLHGLALAAHRIWTTHRPRPPAKPLSTALYACLTFLFVSVCWIFFRAKSLDSAVGMLGQFTFILNPGGGFISPAWLLALLFLPLEYLFISRLNQPATRPLRRLHTWQFAALFGVVLALVQIFAQRSAQPFIYFQF